jgi:hypothetical protein
MADETNLLLEMIKALVRQGISTKNDGVIVWTHCKYCNRSGWVSPDKLGYPMSHDQDCFIEFANKWIAQNTNKDKI